MKYTSEERIDIGKRIYDGEMSCYETAERYDICCGTARDYMRLYRDMNDLPAKNGYSKRSHDTARTLSTVNGMEEYASMTREELINELVMSKINEARLKKDTR